MMNRFDTLSSDVWSKLPVELMREILLYLGSTSTPTACQLRLVSRHTNIWILPLLFRTLALTTPEHVSRFASTLLPKRRHFIPALKSTLHKSPRPLSSYGIENLAIAVKTRLPSVEEALASVAPAFTHVKNLAIASQNLSSNAHWLRQHAIHPRYMMLLHFGYPHMVNFKEPVFQNVTHLFTSVLFGHRQTSVADLPNLTHLAVQTRFNLGLVPAQAILKELQQVLASAPRLQHLVMVISMGDQPERSLDTWSDYLQPVRLDKRFQVIPGYDDAQVEWQAVLEGRPDVWDRARTWCSLAAEDELAKLSYRVEMIANAEKARKTRRKNGGTAWDVDLVESENYWREDIDPTERSEAIS